MNDFQKEKQAGSGQDLSQIPPSDLQAEQSVLGAIMLDPNAISKSFDFIHKGSFYWKKHSIIFEVMNDLFHKNEPIDLLTVSAALKAKNKLEDIGGDFYLAELTETVPFPRNIEYYAALVQRKFILRQLSEFSEDLGMNVFDPSAEPDILLDKSITELFNLQKHSERSGFKEIEPITHETLDDISRMMDRDEALTGTGSGFPILDNLTGGFQKSDLIILAARPSMGKTALALSFAYNAANLHKVPVGIISLEMSSKQIAMRMLSFVSEIPLYKLRNARLSKDEWMRVPPAASRLSSLPIFIDDTPAQTITDVRARARRLQMQYDVGLIVLDYLQLMQPPRGAESQQQAIANISRQLKGLAKELDIPVIALSQLSRAVETRGGSKRPILSDLRDSGAIEQDADVVMFVYRQAYYDRLEKKNTDSDDYIEDNTAEVIIGKQRNGPTGVAKLVFLEDRAQFYNMETQQAEAPPF